MWNHSKLLSSEFQHSPSIDNNLYNCHFRNFNSIREDLGLLDQFKQNRIKIAESRVFTSVNRPLFPYWLEILPIRNYSAEWAGLRTWPVDFNCASFETNFNKIGSTLHDLECLQALFGKKFQKKNRVTNHHFQFFSQKKRVTDPHFHFFPKKSWLSVKDSDRFSCKCNPRYNRSPITIYSTEFAHLRT